MSAHGHSRVRTSPFKDFTAVLIDRGQSKLHLAFGIPAAILMIGCIAYYIVESLAAGRLLGGGSAAGLVCGIAAGLVIVMEMLLWPRKALRRYRLISTKYWMVAHIWFGLITLPLAIVHTGFHLGGWMPTIFLALFVLAWLSGIYGLAVQNILPRWMLRNLPAETIYSQIGYVSKQAVEDAKQLLLAACGRPRNEKILSGDTEPELVESKAIVVGAVRQSGKTQGRTLETRRVADAREDSDALWTALLEIEPFLEHGRRAETPVTDQRQAAQWFSRLRSACGDSSASIIDTLESMCDQRRQFDTQETVHLWLHTWLPIHIGLSVAVSVLLIAHVFTALKYW